MLFCIWEWELITAVCQCLDFPSTGNAPAAFHFPLPPCVSGLRVLLGSVPAERPPGLRPLWLRCEWNVLQLEELPELVKQAAVRGVNIQLPPVRGRCRGAGVWKGSAAGCARPADSHTETQAAARVQTFKTF